MIDDGYIKFEAHWSPAAALPVEALADLKQWRQRLHALDLIGMYSNGIGYGNLSRRWGESGQFAISGSATGGLPELGPEHFVLVTSVDIERNQLTCVGPIVASSESMSHAVIYHECPWVDGVIHVHSLPLWTRLLHRVPTTDKTAAYGTPEMARSIVDLLTHTDLALRRIFVMEGHPEGVFAFGKDLASAGEVLLRELELPS